VCVAGFDFTSNTATFGMPSLYGIQLSPPSIDRYMPTSVPAQSWFGNAGSNAMALTGTFGKPDAASAQGRHARLSRDLTERLRAGDVREASIIVTGARSSLPNLRRRSGCR